MRRLAAPAWIAAGAGLLWLAFGHGFANYDTLYGLVWGDDLAHGRTPDYDVPLAPTPHPLTNLLGLVLSPLGGEAAEDVTVALAFLALGALAYVTYALGARCFGAAAGLLAAAIVVTRVPVLSFGVRAYADIPYVALVLGAVLLEVRRPRAGWPVLALLGVAGLLRPEAWLFSAAYLAWLAWAGDRKRLVGLGALAAAAPVVWLLSDLLVAGDALHSLTGTRDTAQTLDRPTGLDDVPTVMPRRLGEILREPVLVGAAGGGLIALAWARERARLPAVAGVVSVASFCVLAAAGLPAIGRYLLLPAAILAVFCGAGALGWTGLAREDSRRRPWMAFGALVVVLLLAFAPKQVDRLDSLRDSIALQEEIRDDLGALADRAELESGRCRPVGVPNHRAVPLLALRLDRPPEEIVSAQLRRLERGAYFDPATARVERNFILDPRDPRRLDAEVPPGFALAARNRSWRLYERC